jgi:hypothetical protein
MTSGNLAAALSEEGLRQRARLLLAKLPPRETLTTAELIKALFPGEGMNPLRRIAAAYFGRGPEELAMCWTRGKPQRSHYGKVVRPYLWHAPHVVCERCNGTGFVRGTPLATSDTLDLDLTEEQPLWTV